MGLSFARSSDPEQTLPNQPADENSLACVVQITRQIPYAKAGRFQHITNIGRSMRRKRNFLAIAVDTDLLFILVDRIGQIGPAPGEGVQSKFLNLSQGLQLSPQLRAVPINEILDETIKHLPHIGSRCKLA